MQQAIRAKHDTFIDRPHPTVRKGRRCRHQPSLAPRWGHEVWWPARPPCWVGSNSQLINLQAGDLGFLESRYEALPRSATYGDAHDLSDPKWCADDRQNSPLAEFCGGRPRGVDRFGERNASTNTKLIGDFLSVMLSVGLQNSNCLAWRGPWRCSVKIPHISDLLTLKDPPKLWRWRCDRLAENPF